MSETKHDDQPSCPECGGATVQFRGHGHDAEYRVCSRWKEPGHLDEPTINQRIAQHRRMIMPSGRFA